MGHDNLRAAGTRWTDRLLHRVHNQAAHLEDPALDMELGQGTREIQSGAAAFGELIE